MNKKVLMMIMMSVFLAFSQTAFGKAHVPLDRVQVCDPGDDDDHHDNRGAVVKTLKVKKLADALADGACRLRACDFGNVVMTGDACDATDVMGHPISGGANGICDSVEVVVNSGVGTTAQCAQPF